MNNAPSNTEKELNKYPELSIVLPIYCGASTIEKCIISILKQAIEEIELILIDDSSKDKSIELIQPYLTKTSFPYKLIIHEKNQGIAHTLNEGLKYCRGKYVLIIHQDCELISNHYISEAIETLKKNSKIIAVSGKPLYPVKELGFWEKIFMIHSGHTNQKSLRKIENISFSEHKCDVFKTDILLQSGGFDQINFKLSGEDQLKSYLLKKAGFSILRNNNLLFIQRYGKSIASFTGFLKKIFNYGLYQSKVILATRGKTLTKEYRTRELNVRFKNRMIAVILPLISLFFAAFWVSTQNSIFFILMLLPIVIRSIQLVLSINRKELKINLISLLISSVFIFIADIIYDLGLFTGILARILRR